MKNITKKIFLAIVSLSFLASAASAGELTVTGSAKATYSILGSGSTTAKSGQGKGIGIANEFTLGASGDLDNGWAWKYAQDIDGATVQDDASLVITMGDLGTLGIMVTEGGLSQKYGFDASAYGVGSDTGYGGGATSSGTSANTMQYGKNISSYNNIQYHTPAGILPFGIAAKVAVAPNGAGNANDNASSNFAGTDNNGGGDKATEYQITAAPIDGLSIGASYFTLGGEAGLQQGYEAGSLVGKYTMGPVTVGYGETRFTPNLEKQAIDTAFTRDYKNKAYSIGFAVNEGLSISYTNEESVKRIQTNVDATGTETHDNRTMEISTIQAAYTMGGMTLSISSKDVDGDSYVNNQKVSETLLAVAMAF
jgi:hypothetical protein